MEHATWFYGVCVWGGCGCLKQLDIPEWKVIPLSWKLGSATVWRKLSFILAREKEKKAFIFKTRSKNPTAISMTRKYFQFSPPFTPPPFFFSYIFLLQHSLDCNTLPSRFLAVHSSRDEGFQSYHWGHFVQHSKINRVQDAKRPGWEQWARGDGT